MAVPLASMLRITALALTAVIAPPAGGRAVDSFLSPNPQAPDAIVYGREHMATPSPAATPSPGSATPEPAP